MNRRMVEIQAGLGMSALGGLRRGS